MELLEGENLAERIARIGALSPLDVVRVVTHVARAMSRAHELGIVHRDLKPENIFLVSNGDEEIARVLTSAWPRSHHRWICAARRTRKPARS
ncbi:MAG: lipopolysaccharide kinase InaA family protein [Polyangiaceae bacterium]